MGRIWQLAAAIVTNRPPRPRRLGQRTPSPVHSHIHAHTGATKGSWVTCCPHVTMRTPSPRRPPRPSMAPRGQRSITRYEAPHTHGQQQQKRNQPRETRRSMPSAHCATQTRSPRPYPYPRPVADSHFTSNLILSLIFSPPPLFFSP